MKCSQPWKRWYFQLAWQSQGINAISPPKPVPDLANWWRSSFLQSTDATLEYNAQVICYQLITVCPSVKIKLPFLLKIWSVKVRGKGDHCLLGLAGDTEYYFICHAVIQGKCPTLLNIGTSQGKHYLGDLLENNYLAKSRQPRDDSK